MKDFIIKWRFWYQRMRSAVAPHERAGGLLCLQTPFSEFGSDAADPSVATERDFAKLRRREEKEERAQRAAFAEYQVHPFTRLAEYQMHPLTRLAAHRMHSLTRPGRVRGTPSPA